TDRASGRGQATNRCADADREEITEKNRGEDDHRDEGQRLPVQLVYAGVGARLFQTALRDHGPVHFGERAVRSDHFYVAFLVLAGEATRSRTSHFLGQRANLIDDL